MALQLIKFLLQYNLYIKYNDIVSNILKHNNKEILLLYNYLTKLHDKYEKDLTIEELTLYVLTNCLEKDREVLELLLAELATVDTQDSILSDIIVDAQNRQKAYNLAEAALAVADGHKSFSDLKVLADDLNATESDCAAPEAMFVTNDLEVLYNESVTTQGLRWRLPTLNRMLGSLRKGDFGFVFARPETGKTTFLVSEITYFATQVTKPILWINNEEQGNKVQLRLYQAALGCSLAELYNDIQGNKQKYMELVGAKIKIWDDASIHRKQVEQVVRELEPSLIVFDQLDKIKGFSDDREDLRLGAIYIWARELAKQYCPVIAVCQADASGEGKRWLTMENVANAKTAKQAEADWILGIGKSHQTTEEYMRYLSLSKNKLVGDADTDPNLRHGRETVRILPEIARYGEI